MLVGTVLPGCAGAAGDAARRGQRPRAGAASRAVQAGGAPHLPRPAGGGGGPRLPPAQARGGLRGRNTRKTVPYCPTVRCAAPRCCVYYCYAVNLRDVGCADVVRQGSQTALNWVESNCDGVCSLPAKLP
eukprot:993953-Prorocentrum_minimum.AAC.1